MRVATHGAEFIKAEDGDLKGVAFGFDYCAEHEWGTSEIRSNLGVTQGVDAREAYVNYPNIKNDYPLSINKFRIQPQNLYVLKGSASLSKIKSGWRHKELIENKKAQYAAAQKEATGNKNVRWIKNIEFMFFGNDSRSFLLERLPYVFRQLVDGLNLKEGQTPPSFNDVFEACETETGGMSEIIVKDEYASRVYKIMSTGFTVSDPGAVAYVPSQEWQQSHVSNFSVKWDKQEFQMLAIGMEACSSLASITLAAKTRTLFFGINPTSSPFSRSCPVMYLESGMTEQDIQNINESLARAKNEAADIYEKFHRFLKAHSDTLASVRIERVTSDSEYKIFADFKKKVPGCNNTYSGWVTLPQLTEMMNPAF